MPTGRKLERALKKQDRGYPDGWDVAEVDSADWVSQFEVIEQLGVSAMRVGLWISIRRLVPVHNQVGQAGVTRSSIESLCARRRGAGRFRRGGQLIADLGRSFIRNGI